MFFELSPLLNFSLAVTDPSLALSPLLIYRSHKLLSYFLAQSLADHFRHKGIDPSGYVF